jgi:exosortase
MGKNIIDNLTMQVSKQITTRNMLFLFFNIAAIMLFYAPLRKLFSLSLHNANYSHIILIPFISAYLMLWRRKAIFADIHYSYAAGIILIIAGGILFLIEKTQGLRLEENDSLSLMIFAYVIFWMGGFVLFYGLKVFRAGIFPTLFLLLLIPIPDFILEKLIVLLQIGSTELTSIYFKLIGIPFLREGFVFHLPGISIEVAKACSGIRSSTALFIMGIILGYMFLQTGWRRTLLLLCVLPLAIIKNGIRILTLSLLAVYVDTSFITNSSLHHDGGIVFFLIALALLVPILWLLRKSEKKAKKVRNI